MSTHAPTPEQAHIHDLFNTGQTVKVRAGAGTGKTTTLLQLAEILAEQQRIGLYVAFNKSIATEAGRKFGPHVTASTAHSIAYRSMGRLGYGALLDKMRNSARVPFATTAKELGIRGANVPGTDGNRYLGPFIIVRHTLKTVEKYCQTADETIGPQHVPPMIGITDHRALVDIVLPHARRAWADALDINGTAVPFGHGHYLKLWALSHPLIGPEGAALFLDEAQDTSPVLAAVIAEQTHLQRVYVGDSAQSIYGFTGAIDAMRHLDAAAEGRLTQSWRFGQAIADTANVMLARLGDDMRLTGNPAIGSHLNPHTDPDAILTRTNGRAIVQVMAAQRAGRRVHLASDTAYAQKFCDGADKLMGGSRAGLEDLSAFETWFQVQEHAENSPDASDWKVLVDLIDAHGTHAIRQAMTTTVPEQRAEVIVSTAHKSKGREWGHVRLDEDIAEAVAGAKPDSMRDELMLAYVAITRAQFELAPGGLLADADPFDTFIDTAVADMERAVGIRGGHLVDY